MVDAFVESTCVALEVVAVIVAVVVAVGAVALAVVRVGADPTREMCVGIPLLVMSGDLKTRPMIG